MPKFKIYDAPTSDEKPLALELRRGSDSVNLVTVDEDGDLDYFLISFNDDGTVTRHVGLGDLGLELTDDGELKFDDEE